jgi:hypothetical protein
MLRITLYMTVPHFGHSKSIPRDLRQGGVCLRERHSMVGPRTKAVLPCVFQEASYADPILRPLARF